MEGPKLEPFQGTASADIRFERFLGSNKDLDSKVWRVRIDGRNYALKIVSTTTSPFINARPASMTGEWPTSLSYDRHTPPNCFQHKHGN